MQISHWVQKHARLRAEAAVLAAEGKPAEAAERAAQARHLLRQDIDAGTVAAQIEWLEELLAKPPASNRQATPPTVILREP